MIYIDTGHHFHHFCDRRHCACLVNVQRSVLFTRVALGERTRRFLQPLSNECYHDSVFERECISLIIYRTKKKTGSASQCKI